MTSLDTTITPARVDTESYVDWSAVLAGAVAALAVSLVLLSFGSAVGLASVTPWTSARTAALTVGLGSAFWFLLTNLWAFALGGYLAARLRHRVPGSSTNEARFRDSAHGAIAWATAVIFAACVGVVAAASAAGHVAQGAMQATSGVSGVVAPSIDKLLRNAKAAPITADTRDEVSRVIVADLTQPQLPDADKAYLADLVSARAGIDRGEAEQRVTTAFSDAKTAAEQARKAGIVIGFLTAAVLLVGAATAWWAAGVGGRHRDEGELFSGFALGTRRRI